MAADIAKCTDIHCPSKDKCYRFTAPSGMWQSYGVFNREEDADNCDMFWDNGTCSQCGLPNGNHKLSCETHKLTVFLDQVENHNNSMIKKDKFSVSGTPGFAVPKRDESGMIVDWILFDSKEEVDDYYNKNDTADKRDI